ncbi:MAG: type I DNA topoisomerase [Planctomycetaceae bacterium]|nr:type I DNA topoisomerase [Planctomycetaceae bacterium]
MAKSESGKPGKKASGTGNKKSLVIVESPAKARTISKFLGRNFAVEASIGHVRDLPTGKKDIPEQFKSEPWARLAVNVDKDFEPVYIVPPGKKAQITKLKKLLKESDELFLATDEDREGEAISWHLHEILQPKVPVHRMVFHEITQTAIDEALQSPRTIDDGLVKAQETRRILDRLYGYEISEYLWKKRLGQSAGRVQSVAVRLIVNRERERIAFVDATYWDLIANFATGTGQFFDATLISIGGKRLAIGKDFDSTTGRLKDDSLVLLDRTTAESWREKLRQARFQVSKQEVKPYSQHPSPPFITSTLQQEANRKLGFTARRTMSASQSLYENGFITYMRTDSTNLSDQAIQAARTLVRQEYGPEYLPDSPRRYASKSKNAQEAHEAIRPAGTSFRFPKEVAGQLSDDEYRLYEMIWKRTVACQMAAATGNRVTVQVSGGEAVFQASGKTIEFPGYLRAYVEGSDDPSAELADQEKILPSVREGEAVDCRDLNAKDHTTQPPARFSEASLTRELERLGIGRPSTYAAIIETIQRRNYVFKRGNALVPRWQAFSMVRILEENFPKLVDYQFTAEMEDLLDSISRNELSSSKYLGDFYFGSANDGLKQQLLDNMSVSSADVCTFPLGTPPATAEQPNPAPISVRVYSEATLIQQGEDRKASVPDDLPPDELTLAKATELLAQSAVGDTPLGVCPNTGREVYVKSGRFGPYVQLAVADPEGKEKPINASLLKGMEPGDVTVEMALALLSLPRNLGVYEPLGEPVLAHNGRFGPYVKCGAETRSIPAGLNLLTITLEQAGELLAKPRFGGRSAAKEPLKVLADSPVTGQPIKLLEGRYGPYLTDGETNASLPKTMAPETVTDEIAQRLLAERAAATGGTKKAKRSPGRGANRTAGGKKSAKATTKKSSKKKS